MNLFSRVGIVLWGDVNAAWAEALGIGERTIRRFRSGDMEPPPGVWWEMLMQVQGMRERTFAHAHSSEWAELEDQIKAELPKEQRPTAAPYINR